MSGRPLEGGSELQGGGAKIYLSTAFERAHVTSYRDFDIIARIPYRPGVPKRPAPKRRTASDRERKATTFRLDPQLHKGLVLLQGVLRRPLNRLVNEAVQGFIERRTAEVESELLEVLTRVRAYRRSDPKFENAISQFVAAEASLGAGDPVEGRPSRDRRSGKRVGPAQTLVHGLLRG